MAVIMIAIDGSLFQHYGNDNFFSTERKEIVHRRIRVNQ